MKTRPIHPDFQFCLDFKSQALIDLFCDLREFVLDIYPESNELLYHTHALTTVFSISGKLSDAFCHIPIYNQHLNLGFNMGTRLNDPENLLLGTGKLIRHIPIRNSKDYRRPEVEALLEAAIAFAIDDMEGSSDLRASTISKIKTKK